jgi:hypothetical protein
MDVFQADWLFALPINRDEPQDFNESEGDEVTPNWTPGILLSELTADRFGIFGIGQRVAG